MTPCEEKGYKVGQVFEDERDGEFRVLVEDDGSDIPYFFSLSRDCPHQCSALSNHTRIYPPEEKQETIDLMGKTYSKAEIEEALSDKALDKLVDDLNRPLLLNAMSGMINWTDEQLEEENIKLAKMLEDQEND